MVPFIAKGHEPFFKQELRSRLRALGIKHSPPCLQSSDLVSAPCPTSPHTTLPSSLPSSHIQLLSLHSSRSPSSVPLQRLFTVVSSACPRLVSLPLIVCKPHLNASPQKEMGLLLHVLLIYAHSRLSRCMCEHIHTTRSSRRAGTTHWASSPLGISASSMGSQPTAGGQNIHHHI